MSFLDLSSLGTGAVVAPAGHGKTYTIGQTVLAHPELSILVLTHTHTGISALRRQIGPRPIRQLRLETIASFALKIVRAFPGRGFWVETDSLNFDDAHIGALHALASPTVLGVVAGAYDLLIVDEYQDCSAAQAGIIGALSERMPTVVVGDPMQAIFDFGSQPAVPWNGASPALPLLETLGTPHRWARTNPRLGGWLRDARQALQVNQVPTIDQTIVEVARLNRRPAEGGLNALLKTVGRTVSTAVITPNSAVTGPMAMIARAYQGRILLAEKADYAELRKAACAFDRNELADQLVTLIDFAALSKTAVMTSPVTTLKRNLMARGQPSRSDHETVLAAQHHLYRSNAESAAVFFRSVLAQGASSYRPELAHLMLRGLNLKSADPDRSLDECVETLLEQKNHTASTERNGKVVGSTLRLKGLEFDTVIVLDPRKITSSKHLYVALTRATRRLILANS